MLLPVVEKESKIFLISKRIFGIFGLMLFLGQDVGKVRSSSPGLWFHRQPGRA